MSVDIQFSYPPTYPDEVPGVEIVDQTGLSPEQVTELETFLNEQVIVTAKLLLTSVLSNNPVPVPEVLFLVSTLQSVYPPHYAGTI